MAYKMIYKDSALEDLDNLEKSIAKRIVKKLDYYLKLKDPLKQSKKLKGFKVDTYRFRVGDYRVIFRIDEKTKKLVILVVLKIAHRKEIY